jgi:alkanesulfonate monooxygenase SsuD/methylene tetrahydromethanopterin reductase-like flavin-dependent oxidoreductase (luciferase family)
MQVGTLLIFQNFEHQISDNEIYWNNIELGELTDALGYDSVWCIEHHFDADYSMCPDNLQLLSYLAARTTNVQLGTAAVIVPWNDPLRVAEKAAMMDILSKGRFILGLGRGLARMEYEGMRQDMNESRERFDEAAEMILQTLESGIAEHSGKYYQQPRVEIHPLPLSTFKGRTYGVAMSPDSAEAAARLKLGMMAFVQGDVEKVHLPTITLYRDAYRNLHHEEPPPVVFADFCYCHSDSGVAAEVAAEYTANYFRTVVTHYEFAGEHFSATKGYESHGQNAKLIREAGLEATCQGFVDAQISGTPDEMIEKIMARREVVGDFDTLLTPYHGGIPIELATEGLRLVSKEVLPVIRKL